jgi:uncharacterized protein YjdB/poly(3-hydroxybutyrate) depolymerase
MKKNILLKVVVVLLLSVVGIVSNAQTFEFKSHTNTSVANYSMPYRLFIPSGYTAGTSYPLVVYLHGAPGRGTNNTSNLDNNTGATMWAEAANQALHPCFVVVPQCPLNRQWVNTPWTDGSYSSTDIPISTELKMVKDIIETLQTQYNIDASRLYINGLSMGGYGTWDFILRYPTMFKAAIIICGGGDPSKASGLGNMPLLVFHSSDDPTVPVSGSQEMVNAISALGPNDRSEFYSEYNDQGHASWINAYKKPDLVNWLFTTPSISVNTNLVDITEQAGTITSQGGNALTAFDNATNTKWIDNANAYPGTRSSWVQYQVSGTYMVTQYNIISANDAPERDPKNWNLLGSNDGSNWATLDTRTNEVFNSRIQKKSFSFTNTTPYTYYKLQINSVYNPSSASSVQLAEFEIFGTLSGDPIPVTGVSVSQTSVALNSNEKFQLTATVSPANATSKNVSWKSSDPNIASVSISGVVTGKAPGTATVTVTTADGDMMATVTVISRGGPAGYTYSCAENATVVVSGTMDIAFGANGSFHYKYNQTDDCGCNSTTFAGDPISGTLKDCYTKAVGSISIPVTGVIMSPTTISAGVNSTSQLTAIVAPENATNKGITWSSGNTSIATVSTSGLVMGKSVGSATITATTSDGDKTATCLVTVYKSDFSKSEAEEALLSGININNNHTGYSGSGFVAQFNAVGQYVQFSIPDAAGGSQNIVIRYANANTQARALSLYVNGIKVDQISFPTTPNWATWADKEYLVTLNEGNNTIKIQVDNGDTGQFNIDFLSYRVSDGSTGIEIPNSDNESDISLSPNPLSTGSLSIKLPEGATQLSILDITGKMVYQQKVTRGEYLIDLSEFKSGGVYFVNVMTSTNSINKKLIVSK